MGNQLCCTESHVPKTKHSINAIQKKNSDSNKFSPFGDAFSTSGDSSEPAHSPRGKKTIQKLEIHNNLIFPNE